MDIQNIAALISIIIALCSVVIFFKKILSNFFWKKNSVNEALDVVKRAAEKFFKEHDELFKDINTDLWVTYYDKIIDTYETEIKDCVDILPETVRQHLYFFKDCEDDEIIINYNKLISAIRDSYSYH